MSSRELTRLVHQIFAEHHPRKPAPPVDARFYAYANLNHTVRLRQGRIYLRLSDIMADAPVPALRAIIGILLLKLDRGKRSPDLEAVYRAYAESIEVRARVHQVRQERGRKVLGDHSGKCFDLRASFERLNTRYFQGALHVSTLTWSRAETKRVLGHYDRCHDTIVISRSLDATWVPPLLFEFILFHEMLHACVGDRFHNGRRYAHHREFRREERKFEHYPEAHDLMKQFSARIR
ncbi:MAG: M48 family peptidase [Acidobacteria bacterium]|nr:M48 family peptidase [Acidobacteriota bacterium]